MYDQNLSIEDRVVDIVQRLLSELSIIGPVSNEADLRESGLSSIDMVSLMVRIEASFDLDIPETEITPANFRSISAIANLVTSLRGDA